MEYTENKIEALKQSLNIEEVIRGYGVELNKNNQALCPFHEEKTPSFSVDSNKQIFKCFGCGVGGDVIQFVKLRRNSTFLEAVEELYRNYLITIKQGVKIMNCNDIWNDAAPITEETITYKYLLNRGLKPDITKISKVLRSCSNSIYHDNEDARNNNKPFNTLVAAITDSKNTIIGIQRIYLDEQGLKAKIMAPKKALGKISGGAVKFGLEEPKEIHLTEGIETALAILESLDNVSVWACVSANGLGQVEIPTQVEKVHIWADNDLSNTGQKAANKIALKLIKKNIKVSIHTPERTIKDRQRKSLDWLDILSEIGKTAILDAFKDAKPYKSENFSASNVNYVSGNSWGELRPLPTIDSKVTEISSELLPEPFRNWLLDVAEGMQVSLDFVLVPFFVQLACLIGRKLGIKPKKYDEKWLVIPVLWGAIIARPGKKKSPAMDAILAPLKRLEIKSNKKYEEDVIVKTVEVEMIKTEILSVKDQLKKELKKRDTNPDVLEDYKQKLIKLEEKLQGLGHILKRYKTNDATIEKLAEILRDNPNGIMLFRDELTGWLKSLDNPSRGTDRSFFLESWNGNGLYTVDRIIRGTTTVPALCIHILGGLQPSKLKSYVYEATKGTTGDDGLLQRFQILLYPEKSLKKYVDRTNDFDAEKRASDLFEAIDNIDFRRELFEVDTAKDIPFVKFDDKAQSLFDAWISELEERFQSEDDLPPAFEAHLSKYRSLMPILALLFFVIDYAESKDIKKVSLEHVQLAATFCEYFERHARKVYALSLHSDVNAAHELSKKIKKGKVEDGIHVREIYRNQWQFLATPEEVEKALLILQECNWVKRIEGVKNSKTLKINPIILKEVGVKE